MGVEVRCFGPREPRTDGITVRGYTPWERVGGKDGPRFAPALETLSIGLAMARDPVDADVVHAHTWYADMGGAVDPHAPSHPARGHAAQHGAAAPVEGRSARQRLPGLVVDREDGGGGGRTA